MITKKDESIPAETSVNETLSGKMLSYIFVFVILFLGVVLFIGFQKHSRKEEPIPQSQVDTSRSTISQEEFEDQVGREVKSLRELRRLQDKPDPKTPQQIFREIRDRQTPTVAQSEKDPKDELIAKFELEELSKALSARSSPFVGGFETSSSPDPKKSSEGPTDASISSKRKELQALAADVEQQAALAEKRWKQAQTQKLSELSAGNRTSASFPSLNTAENAQTPQTQLRSGFAGTNATYYPNPPFGTVTVRSGVVFKLVLQSRVSSDVPGDFIARVDEDIYDDTGNFVVIPQGSKVEGVALAIQTPNEAINNRIGMTIKTIRRPDGLAIDMADKQLLDNTGLAGIKGKTNYHILAQLIATVGYVTTVGGATVLIDDLLIDNTDRPIDNQIECRPVTTTTTTTDPDGNETVVEETSEFCTDFQSNSGVTVATQSDSRSTITTEFLRSFSQTGSRIFDRYLGLVPTKTLHPGDPMTLITSSDIYVSPWSSVYERFVE